MPTSPAARSPSPAVAGDSATSGTRATGKTFCEFFAGIGLVRLGLAEGGWQCLYANDFDEGKQALYAANFADHAGHFHLADVGETDKVLARLPQQLFLATASFPCVDLSLAGHWRGLEGSRSSAFFAFARVLDAMGPGRPPLVMLENVPGLITSHGGADFLRVADTLAELGYWVDAFVIDARYFVPQSRPRVFLLAVAEHLNPPNVVRSTGELVHDPWLAAVSRREELRPPKLRQLMERQALATGWFAANLPPLAEQRPPLEAVIDFDDDQPWWPAEQVEKHLDMMSPAHRAEVESLRQGDAWRAGGIYRRRRAAGVRAEVRFDGLAGCLRTPKGGSARQIVIAVGHGQLRMRWMTPREYARLQGADDFELVGSAGGQLYGFGDAVCVPVIRWIDQHVLTPIYEAA